MAFQTFRCALGYLAMQLNGSRTWGRYLVGGFTVCVSTSVLSILLGVMAPSEARAQRRRRPAPRRLVERDFDREFDRRDDADTSDNADTFQARPTRGQRRLPPRPMGKPPYKGLGFGMGVGYVVEPGFDVLKPTMADFRLDIGGGLMLEPTLIYAQSETGVTDTNQAEDDPPIKSVDMGLRVGARYELFARGPVQLLGLGGLSYRSQSQEGGSTGNEITTTTISLDWGLGLTYWFNWHWAITFDLRNPLYTSTSEETVRAGAADPTTRTEETNEFAIQFNPTAMIFLHLWL